MQLNSETPLAIELKDQEIRQHTVESQIKIGLPFQIRAMREHRGWTQDKLAERIGTTQNTISRLENPKTGKPTITTLLRIANACDVGLLVRFVPFGFYGDVIEAMNPAHIEVPSYSEELKNQAEAERAKVAAVAATSGHLTLGDLARMTAKAAANSAFFLRMVEADAAYKASIASYTQQLEKKGKAASHMFGNMGLKGNTSMSIVGMMDVLARASHPANQSQRTANSAPAPADYLNAESAHSADQDIEKQLVHISDRPNRGFILIRAGKVQPRKRPGRTLRHKRAA